MVLMRHIPKWLVRKLRGQRRREDSIPASGYLCPGGRQQKACSYLKALAWMLTQLTASRLALWHTYARVGTMPLIDSNTPLPPSSPLLAKSWTHRGKTEFDDNCFNGMVKCTQPYRYIYIYIWYICIYVYTHKYIHMHLSLSLSRSLHIQIHVYAHVYTLAPSIAEHEIREAPMTERCNLLWSMSFNPIASWTCSLQ